MVNGKCRCGGACGRCSKSELLDLLIDNFKVLVDNPAKSEAQRRYLNATFGHDWVKEFGFDNRGPLPSKVTKNMNKRCDGCGGLESNCDCSMANKQTTTNLGGPVKTDIRDQLISNSLIPLSRQEGKRFNLFGDVVSNAPKVDTQLRHLETGQFMPKSGASQKQTHSAAEKGADQGQGQSMAKPGQDDSGGSTDPNTGGEVVPGQESNELDDEAGKRGMSSSELKKQLGIQDKKPTKNLASWFMSNLTDNAWSDAAREASAAARKASKLGVTSFDSKGFASAGAKGASQLASKASEGAKGSRTGHEQAAAYHGIAAKEHDKAADLHEKGNSSKAVVEAHRNAAEAHRGAQEEHSNMLSTRKQG